MNDMELLGHVIEAHEAVGDGCEFRIVSTAGPVVIEFRQMPYWQARYEIDSDSGGRPSRVSVEVTTVDDFNNITGENREVAKEVLGRWQSDRRGQFYRFRDATFLLEMSADLREVECLGCAVARVVFDSQASFYAAMFALVAATTEEVSVERAVASARSLRTASLALSEGRFLAARCSDCAMDVSGCRR